MRKQFSYGILVTAVSMVLLTTFILLNRSHQQRHFSCYTHYHSRKNTLSLNVILRFDFNGDEGIVTMTGRVNDERGGSQVVNKKMLYSFTHTASHYLMISKKKFTPPHDEADDASLAQFVAPFFFEEGHKLLYRFFAQKNGDYLIEDGKLPLGYCQS
ncbi:hypothetical protein [Enterobacter sp. UNJFSC 003]|uniref:hypothetical protein n=1 Tax=Enterobacter sp. UNJFSC 003 TaxID=3122077 RepID=UPI002EA240EF|nr:hypothetical protein [Serratia liquefaciens]